MIVALAWTGLEAADPPGSSAAKAPPKAASAEPPAPASKAGPEEVASTLDQALAQAMENHPDIVAAKAKLTLAEAELNGTRMDVARKVIGLWSGWQAQKAARDRMWQTQQKVPGTVPRETLIAEEASLARTETELRYLIGLPLPGMTRSAVSAAAAKTPQMPRGPVVEKIRKALSSPSQLEFSDESLLNVLDYMKDYHKVEIHVDSKAFEEDRTPIEKEKMSINTKGAPLAAALQLIEDQRPPVRFVVRDYGILVTTSKRAEEEGFMSAVKFAYLSAGDEATCPSDPLDPARPRTSLPAKNAGTRPKPSAESDPFAPPGPPKPESRPKSPPRPDPFAP